MNETGEWTGEESERWRQPEAMGKFSRRPWRQRSKIGIGAGEILSPEERMELAIQSLAGGSRALASRVGRRMINNPLPVALAGVGISWLLLMGRDKSPVWSGSLREVLLLKRERYGSKRLGTAAGLLRERGAGMGARLAMLAKEKPFALGAFAFSAGAALGSLLPEETGEIRLSGKEEVRHPAATGEMAALTAHSEIRSQAGGFGPEETELEMGPAV